MVPRRLLTSAAILLGAAGVAACQSPGATSGPDCVSQLRFHGATYTAYRLTRDPDAKVGAATPWCAGAPVHGAAPVTVWSLPGVPSTQALARPSAGGRFAVYVADALSPERRSRLLHTISRP